MNPLDEQGDALVAILRANGATVGIAPDAPDYVKRAFLEMILGCADCPVPNDALAQRVQYRRDCPDN